MKLWTVVLAVVVAISMAGLAEAKGNKAGKGGKAEIVKGKIVSVATGGSSMVIKAKKSQGQTTLATNAKTKVKGAATSVADLKAGERVKAKVKNGVAKSIKVKAAKAKNAGKKSVKSGGKKAGKRGGKNGRK